VRHGGHEPGESDENDGHERNTARQGEPVGMQTRDQGPNPRGEDGDDPDEGDRHEERCSGSDQQQGGMSGHRRGPPGQQWQDAAVAPGEGGHHHPVGHDQGREHGDAEPSRSHDVEVRVVPPEWLDPGGGDEEQYNPIRQSTQPAGAAIA
jgi:hypothetical protein